MNYAVGQIIFVVLKKQMQIYPMQVVEEITKKTLAGEEVNYVVRGGQDPKTTLMVSEIDGEIFDSSDKARISLTERATKSIEKLVESAVQKSQEWYGPEAFEAPAGDVMASLKKQPSAVVPTQQKPGPPPRPRRGNGTPVDEGANVKLEDGTIVKVKLPEQFS
jgi:hypothetical protein